MYDAAFHTFGVSNTHMSKKLTLLAIESSCDDTSVAVLRDDKVLSNCVASQEAHRIYQEQFGLSPSRFLEAQQLRRHP